MAITPGMYRPDSYTGLRSHSATAPGTLAVFAAVESVLLHCAVYLPEKVKRSNREAARQFTEMFSMLDSTTVVLFTTEAEARAAKTSFKEFSGQCLNIDSAGKSAKGFSRR